MSLKLAFEAFRVFIRTERLSVRAGTFLVHMAWVFFVAMLLWCGGFFSQACAAQPPQAALQYRDDVIRNARLEWGLSAPVADFAAQLHQESGWRPDAISPAGAQGLALVSYDRWLWQRVSAASDCERMAMTLSGYNGGLGWVQRDRRLASQKGLDSTRWFGHVATVNAGRNAASWRENRHYPQRILRELAPRYLTWGGSSCVASG